MQTAAPQTYLNSFHKPGHQVEYGPASFEVEAAPISYAGFLIYKRNGSVWDIVKDGVCIGMYAGLGGAKRAIDAGRYSPTPLRDLAIAGQQVAS